MFFGLVLFEFVCFGWLLCSVDSRFVAVCFADLVGVYLVALSLFVFRVVCGFLMLVVWYCLIIAGFACWVVGYI